MKVRVPLLIRALRGDMMVSALMIKVITKYLSSEAKRSAYFCTR